MCFRDGFSQESFVIVNLPELINRSVDNDNLMFSLE